jgi:hypothetical protein
MSRFSDTVARNTPKDFPNLVTGWPDEERGITHDKYIGEMRDRCDDLLNATPDGQDVAPITLESFRDWKDRVREDECDPGFSWQDCDLCGALPGNRYPVTALPDEPSENHDYVALEVCQDCLCYIANGDEPST